MLLAAKNPIPTRQLQDDANGQEQSRSRHAAHDVGGDGTDEEKQRDEMFHSGRTMCEG